MLGQNLAAVQVQREGKPRPRRPRPVRLWRADVFSLQHALADDGPAVREVLLHQSLRLLRREPD